MTGGDNAEESDDEDEDEDEDDSLVSNFSAGNIEFGDESTIETGDEKNYSIFVLILPTRQPLKVKGFPVFGSISGHRQGRLRATLYTDTTPMKVFKEKYKEGFRSVPRDNIILQFLHEMGYKTPEN